VLAVAVQSTFHLKMHQDDVFYFFKIIFNISTSSRSKNTKNFKQNKFKFFINADWTAFSNMIFSLKAERAISYSGMEGS
jgi:hypothetical protein